ncbi:hypothetical protein CCACVL1_24062 [Corchorus capsularis]|uniref:At1g61320/AtMIF1 LRR domain-containing protein n=1 Tax=Corchorus capsularis TaxID=210143 RepID=A0A1R3GR76_COCAP|nr:hypothetical protein CCACVL1_24062 [Corchorus capsularis]
MDQLSVLPEEILVCIISCLPLKEAELIKSLTCLCLKYVKVKVEMLEFVLSNCPLLETLDVSYSELDESSYEEQIIDLKVCGSTSQRLNLKHLHIVLCDKIKSIEVSAPELVSFGFRHHGPNIQLNLKHVPKLPYVTYGASTSDFFFKNLATYASQLVNLSLKFTGSIDKMMLQCPQLPNLRHLTCDVVVVGSSSSLHLIRLISLTNASPRLQKFKLILKEAKDARISEFGNNEIEWVLDEVKIDHKYFPCEYERVGNSWISWC